MAGPSDFSVIELVFLLPSAPWTMIFLNDTDKFNTFYTFTMTFTMTFLSTMVMFFFTCIKQCFWLPARVMLFAAMAINMFVDPFRFTVMFFITVTIMMFIPFVFFITVAIMMFIAMITFRMKLSIRASF
jgi:hypothetical protein